MCVVTWSIWVAVMLEGYASGKKEILFAAGYGILQAVTICIRGKSFQAAEKDSLRLYGEINLFNPFLPKIF